MRELINMVVVLTGISLASGGLLASLREGTQERIDQQVLEFVKGPSVRAVFKDAANDPIATRFQLKDGEAVRTFFVGEIEGAFRGVALESDPAFTAQFNGVPVSGPAKVTKDGGSINAISGATITSRAVAGGVSNAFTVYERLKPQIEQKLKEIRK